MIGFSKIIDYLKDARIPMLYTFVFTDNIDANTALLEYIYQTKVLQFAGLSDDPVKIIMSLFSEKRSDLLFIDTDVANGIGLKLYKMLNRLIPVILISKKK